MIFVFMTFVGSAIYVVIKMAIAPVEPPETETFTRIKGDYVLMLMESVFGMVVMLFSGFLIHKINIRIPHFMLISYAVFLYCAIFLGEVQSFYYNVPHWDTILHTFSGAMLGILGFSFINILNRTDSVPINLSPLFVAVFAFSFAISLGVIWEIYEFSIDCIFRTNMQKFALQDGTLLIGQSAVADTMKDLIVDTIGALIASAIGYISLRYKKGWLEMLQLRFISKKQET